MSEPLLVPHQDHLELMIYGSGQGGYPIDYDQMDTEQKCLAWVHQLLGKRAVTKEHIQAFLAVAEERGINIYL